tara:strand:+ start:2146 stop:5466 length:3321 start_codon:yes stop_codon:yes gene_type:complete
MSIKEFDQNTVLNDPDLPSDALSSKQFNTIVDVISEGEIAGFATPHKRGIASDNAAYKNACKTDIFLNKTPVLNIANTLNDSQFLAKASNPEDSDFNYSNVGFDFRLGTSTQTFIGGIKNIETENPIGTPVTTSTPVTHTVSNTNINAVRVTVKFNSLQRFRDDGDIEGTSVNLKVITIEADGNTKTAINDTVKGRSTNAYLRDYIIQFRHDSVFPVQIRVERVTDDSTDAQLVNAFSFHSATDIIFQQNRYLNTAHAALRIGAEQFPRVPNRTYLLRGIKVKVPHNATVSLTDGSITYSGTFNGTFKTDKEWTTDPAWILYDVLTNDRYGCNIPETKLNKFTFKEVSEYCGEQVDDGNNTNTTEPRFALNVNITQRQDAFNLINDLCSAMRAMPFYNAGGISISQDSPQEPIYSFTNATVAAEGFTYSGSSNKTRHTVINVSYFDLLTQDIDIETVEADTATKNKYGLVIKNINAFGCTSRGQAARFGKWFLYNEQNAGETVVFTTTLDAGVLVRCGHIIEISDSLKGGVRRGGRIKSASGTTITLDDFANTDIPNLNASPTLTCLLPNGTFETRNITSNNAGVLTIASAFSNNPNSGTIFIIETPSFTTTTWRVINVKENEDRTYNITALEHNSEKYDFVEDGAALPVRSISTLTEVKQPPTGLIAEEKIIEINNRAVSKIILDWEPVTGASKYRVQYRVNNGQFNTIETTDSSVDILNTDVGEYEFRVFSYNAIGQPSGTPANLTFNAQGKSAPPANVQNATLEPIDVNNARIRWTQTTDLDVKYGGQVYIRFSEETSGATFANSTDVIEAVGGATTEAQVPLKTGTYSLKFRDTGGRFSTNESLIVVSSPQFGNKLTIISQRENPNFAGTKTNTTVSSNKLKLTNPATSLTGSYNFQNVLDLGGVFSLDVERHIKSVGINQADLFDSIPNLDLRDDFDGSVAQQTNASVLVRTTDDNPSGSPTFNSFNKFFKGTFKGRGFDFKCDINSENANENILVSELGFNASLPVRTDQSTTILTSGTSASGFNATFSSAYFTGTSAIGGSTSAYLPSVMVTAQNMQTGDFYEITSVSGSGFNIKFKNSGGTIVSRNFSFTAVGYGKGG